jgi:hypothetical protein
MDDPLEATLQKASQILNKSLRFRPTGINLRLAP